MTPQMFLSQNPLANGGKRCVGDKKLAFSVSFLVSVLSLRLRVGICLRRYHARMAANPWRWMLKNLFVARARARALVRSHARVH